MTAHPVLGQPQAPTRLAPAPPGSTAEEMFNGYRANMTAAPTLGSLVLYSIPGQPEVTREQLDLWLAELDLDTRLLPPPQRGAHGFTQARAAVKRTYKLGEDGDRSVTMLVREVARDRSEIVCHVVREERDGQAQELTYDTRVGRCTYRRGAGGDLAGTGVLHLTAEGYLLDSRERAELDGVLDAVRERYERACTFLGADRLRGTVRAHLETVCRGIKVHRGMYFVHPTHNPTLQRLSELTDRFATTSSLVCVPLPDMQAARAWVVDSWRKGERDELRRLGDRIAQAVQNGNVRVSTVEGLRERYQQLKTAATEHSSTLQVDLNELVATHDTVQQQLADLFTRVSGS